MSVKGTKTEQNLLAALKGEALARSKYTFFADIARAEGFETAAKIFATASNNEKEHAKLWFRLLNDGKFPSTECNLKDAANGEKYEWSDMYINFAEDARREGFEHIAGLFQKVADIEKSHEEEFKKLLLMLNENDIAPDENGNFVYECSECGCTMEQKERPDYCPLCEGPNVFFFKIKK